MNAEMTAKEIQNLIAANKPLPAGLTTTGYLELRSYSHPLPAGLTTTGNLDLGSYSHPLPAGLTTTGDLDLRSYSHPLPAGLTTTGYLELGSYSHPLPAGLTQRVKGDMFAILDQAPTEVPALLKSLRNGKIDGSTYDGDCRCLVGTLERSRKVSILHDSSRPAERWFVAIRKGDMPENNPSAKYAEQWIEEWMAANPVAADAR
jgi:hypothetical protein